MSQQFNNPQLLLRSLITYAIIVPTAIVIGYLLTDPFDVQSIGVTGFVLAILAFPLLMRWHYELLVFSWLANISVFFLPGRPSLWMLMVPISLGISIVEWILGRHKKFVRAPQVIWPLVILLGVVIFTAELNGGFGFHAFGSAVYGGKKYLNLFLGIASFFALLAREIPPEKAKKYLALFFLGASTNIIGDLYPVCPHSLTLIYLVFPPNIAAGNLFEVGLTRLGGVANAACQGFALVLGLYGVRGIFLTHKIWRPILLGILFVVSLLGGFRIMLLMMVSLFTLMFFLEKLHRTPLLPVFALTGILAISCVIPFADKMPYTFQRAVAFLPLKLDTDARMSAEESTDWRVKIWKALLPEVPDHLLLGKGYSFSAEEYNELMGSDSALGGRQQEFDAANNPLAIAGDYHNGMLSIVLVFGIWGVIAFVWFMFAGIYVTYRNFKYSPPELKIVNALLFSLFFYQSAMYLSCWSGMSIGADMPTFAAYLGLNLAINHGVRRRPISQPESQPAPLSRFPRFQPAR